MMDQQTTPSTAKTFAVQTAVMATIIEALIEAGTLDRLDIANRLYDLLSALDRESATTGASGPIRHLINLIEAN